jgi:hypothetical protein
MSDIRKHAIVLAALTLLALAMPGYGVTWQRKYGGSGTDVAYSVAQLPDSGYIVTGYTSSRGAGKKDVWLLRLGALGDTFWTRTYGGANDDIGWSVAPTSDGGYIIAGETYSAGAGMNDMYLIKTDAAGNPAWTKTFGSAMLDAGYSVQQTADNGYVVAGYTLKTGIAQGYVVKTGQAGDTLWTEAYGGGFGDYAYCVRQTADGGYIVTGAHGLQSGNREIYLMRLSASGDSVWAQGHQGSGNSSGYWVEPITGGYLVVGYSGAVTTEDIALFKTDTAGQTSTYYRYGGAGTEMAFGARLLADGGTIIAGMTNSYGAGGSDVYLIRTNSAEDTLWTRTFGGTRTDQGNSVSPTYDGGFIIAGSTRSFNVESTDVLLIKTDANGVSGIEQELARSPILSPRGPALEILPNPFVSCAVVRGHENERVALYDVSSRKVGVFPGDRIGEGLPAGVYFVQLEGRPDTPQRVVKLR